MGENSKIEWTEATWNPFAGCSRKSEGCRNCYAEVMTKRLAAMGVAKYQGLLNEQGRFNGVVRLDEPSLRIPLKWKKPRRIFVNSMSDLFHENVQDEWIDKVFAVMALTPQHTYQCLTKRPERMVEYIESLKNYQYSIDQYWLGDWVSMGMPRKQYQEMRGVFVNEPLPNVWLGVSIEDQKTADERIPHLLQIPAKVRFLSIEPLLGPVDLRFPQAVSRDVKYPEGFEMWSEENRDAWCETQARRIYMARCEMALHWVIVGGESGSNARPMNLEWAKSIVHQCKAAGVPVFVKQLGRSAIDTDYLRFQTKDKKGGDISEFPVELAIREFPNA